MNYTENYQLPQWEKTDRIMMEDFNDSNQKIEVALSEKSCVICGTYTGNGAAEREINLGGRPKAVLVGVMNASGVNSGYNIYNAVAGDGWNQTFMNSYIPLTVTDNGFKVVYRLIPESYGIYLNSVNSSFYYIAIM